MERHPRADRRWRHDATYLLPIRSFTGHRTELTDYLRGIAELLLPVVVVDGSPQVVFDAVHESGRASRCTCRPLLTSAAPTARSAVS